MCNLVSGESLVPLLSLPRLGSLYITGVHNSDSSVGVLAQLNTLRELCMPLGQDDALTETGLMRLTRLKNLTSLSFSAPFGNDDALKLQNKVWPWAACKQQLPDRCRQASTPA